MTLSSLFRCLCPLTPEWLLGVPNSLVQIGHSLILLKCRFWWEPSGAWDYAFLTSSQVTLIQPIHWSYFKQQSLGDVKTNEPQGQLQVVMASSSVNHWIISHFSAPTNLNQNTSHPEKKLSPSQFPECLHQKGGRKVIWGLPSCPVAKSSTYNTGGLGLLPGQGTSSRMPQLKIPHAPTKIPYAATKVQCNQINKWNK